MPDQLIHSDAVSERGCKSIEIAGEERGVFVVKKDQQLYLYRNSCPHLGVELNWQENQFLDLDGELIQCAMHGALFRIEDGFCLAGPCQGQSLEAVEFSIDSQGYLCLNQ